MTKPVAIGSDHAGFDLKSDIIALLTSIGIEVKDFGPNNGESVDYPDFAHPVSAAVQSGQCELGVLICGSGNGVAMTANKYPNIRAAICWTKELAQLARSHNNANILCLPARFVSPETAKDITNAFFSTEFEGGRHQRRVGKINC
ncbi:MAG: ribose 5-phosphate isomerase B [Cyclobacteriaceae bacterium]|nr:ribose 5-phosphate isomerase B [Cyclobacteriaceae bacterium]